MANPKIIPKKSTIADKVPLTTDLASGEVAINYADQVWYGKHPSTGNVVPIGAPYQHSHDQLLSIDKNNELELTNAGSLVLSVGANATTFTPTSTTNRTLTLPDKSGTLATLDDVSGGGSVPIEIGLACSDETTALTTGTAKVTFRLPCAMTLTAVRATLTTAPVGSTLIVNINEGGSSILSTKLSIDASEKTSTTAATAAVISNSSLADDAEITIDIDQVGSTTAGAGLKVWLIGTR